MKNYYEAMNEDVFNYLPLTFHLKEGVNDPEYDKFKERYKHFQQNSKKQN